MADGTATAAPQVDPGGVQAAIDRFRDLAKYLITIFAAIGGLLVAGTQLTSIGALRWPQNEGRIIVGGLGFILALLAATVIVVKALGVLQPIETSFDRVKEKAGREEVLVSLQLLHPYDSIEQLAFMIESVEATEPGSPAHESLLGQAAEIVDKVAYDEVASRFEKARNWMIGGAMAGTVAIVAFVWAANPPKGETAEPVVRPVPVQVTVSLTKAGREVLESSLGKGCETDSIEAVSIGGSESNPRILALAANGCHLAQFSLPPDWGKATSTRPAPSQPHTGG